MSKWTPKDLPHSPPEAQCQSCCDWFWECDLVDGICQPCAEEKAELEILKQDIQMTTKELNRLQQKHEKITGKRFVSGL